MNERKNVLNPTIKTEVFACCNCGLIYVPEHKSYSFPKEKNTPKWIKEQYEDKWVVISTKNPCVCGEKHFYRIKLCKGI